MTVDTINYNSYLLLSAIIDDVQRFGISLTFVESILDLLLPEGISYDIEESKYNEGKITFYPSLMNIKVSLGKVYYWQFECVNNLIRNFGLTNRALLEGYALVEIINHEIEHSRQYLAGLGKSSSSCHELDTAYGKIYEVIENDTNSQRVNNYYENSAKLLLERNAQIASYELITRIAKYNKMIDYAKIFELLKYYHMTLGYENSKDGSILQTFKVLQINDNSIIPVHLSEKQKQLYGFPIRERTRKSLLKTINNK